MTAEHREVVALIREAFSASDPPAPDQLVPESLHRWRPFEAEELLRGLGGVRWTEISREFIDTHSDWPSYLSPQTFRYYLPAWLLYSLDLMNADYAAQWAAAFLSGPPAKESIPDYQAQLIGALDARQRDAVIAWLKFLVETYPDEDVGYLDQKEMTVEDAVINISVRMPWLANSL